MDFESVTKDVEKFLLDTKLVTKREHQAAWEILLLLVDLHNDQLHFYVGPERRLTLTIDAAPFTKAKALRLLELDINLSEDERLNLARHFEKPSAPTEDWDQSTDWESSWESS